MKKNWIALVLSILFPGLGHLYLGRVGKGVALVLADIIATLSISIFIGVILLPAVYIYSIIDAYKLTDIVNQEIKDSRF
ncbi:DUF6677 family protein [Priestia endophytica]|uniref:DUF6677 family protein n=1 Tax=Priestia endophytica TaxID=135735 RepID=UPI00124D9074|nr:DUF6677 family protein [Priestia endophytica]KAB2488212.1 sugar ABC transporter permease [Priestia endophytica]